MTTEESAESDSVAQDDLIRLPVERSGGKLGGFGLWSPYSYFCLNVFGFLIFFVPLGFQFFPVFFCFSPGFLGFPLGFLVK